MSAIGFVGLGHMGLPMTVNLIKAGHEVAGFDLQASALEALSKAGGKPCHDLQELVQNRDVIITMLQTGEQVKSVCLSEKGLFSLLKPGTVYIDCSSIDVQSSRAIHQEAQAQGLLVLDAPVSGGVGGAVAGSLTFMVGAELEAFKAAEPILQAMGKNIIHTGAAGSGQAAKICNNMILGISMIAVSEGFTLAKHLGLAADKLLEVVNVSSGQCWVTSKYLPVPNVMENVPANNHYQPGFTAQMMLKDLKLSQNAAKSTQVNTEIAAKATAIYQQFVEQGFGDLDFSAIIQTIEH